MEHTSVKKARFPEFCDKFRELQGSMTDVEFGKKLGISRQTVGFYRNGDRIPDALGLRDIARKCGVSADYLLGLTECPAVNDKVKAACEYTGLSVDAVKHLNDVLIKDDLQYGAHNPAFRVIASNFIASNAIYTLCSNVLHISEKLKRLPKIINSTPELKEKMVIAFKPLLHNRIANMPANGVEYILADKIDKDFICEKVEIIEEIEQFIDNQARYSKARQEVRNWIDNIILSDIDFNTKKDE